jgi:hypothetical protein
MGPRETPPPLPDIEPGMVEAEAAQVWTALRECNWVVAMPSAALLKALIQDQTDDSRPYRHSESGLVSFRVLRCEIPEITVEINDQNTHIDHARMAVALESLLGITRDIEKSVVYKSFQRA